MLLSRFILPSPFRPVSICSFSVAASLFLSPNRCICTNFFRFHIYLVNGICSSLSCLGSPRNICKMGIIRGYQISLPGVQHRRQLPIQHHQCSTPRGTVRFAPWTTSASSPSMAWWCRPATRPGQGLLLRKSSPPPSRTVGAWPPCRLCRGDVNLAGWDRGFSSSGKRVLINSPRLPGFAPWMHLDGKAKIHSLSASFSCISSPRGGLLPSESKPLPMTAAVWAQCRNSDFSKNFS